MPIMECSMSDYPDFGLECITYEWRIKDFSCLRQGKDQFIDSEEFYGIDIKVGWKLRLYPHGQSFVKGTSDPTLSVIYTHRVDSLCVGPVEVKLFGSKMRLEFVTRFLEGKKLIAQYNICLTTLKLRDNLDVSDTLIIPCEICMSGAMILPLPYMKKPIEHAFDSQKGQLSQDFRLLLDASKLSDVTLLVGTQKFSAHKVVLAARSSVFSAMFENKDTQENVKNEVKIEDMEPEVVKAMLEFFYTDEVANLEEVAYELVAAANKYDVQHLRSKCEQVLYEKLDEKNAAEFLVHSDLHCSDQLKKQVMAFVIDNLVRVVPSEGYKVMEKEHPRLLGELIQLMVAEKIVYTRVKNN